MHKIRGCENSQIASHLEGNYNIELLKMFIDRADILLQENAAFAADAVRNARAEIRELINYQYAVPLAQGLPMGFM